jgi:hypothetical protein
VIVQFSGGLLEFAIGRQCEQVDREQKSQGYQNKENGPWKNESVFQCCAPS